MATIISGLAIKGEQPCENNNNNNNKEEKNRRGNEQTHQRVKRRKRIHVAEFRVELQNGISLS